MTTIPQPDFVGRLLGDGAELAVRPLLPSLFDPVPVAEPSPEPGVQHQHRPSPQQKDAEPVILRPEAVVPELAPGPVDTATPVHPAPEPVSTRTPLPRPETEPVVASPPVRAALPDSPAAVRKDVAPQQESVHAPKAAEVLPTTPVRRSRRAPIVVATTPPKEIAVPVLHEVVKSVVQQEKAAVTPVIPVVTPVAPVAPIAEAPRPVAPRRSRPVEQTVHITIGRVEVKAAAEKTPERRAPARRQPTTSLEDYLRRRGGGTS
ncbi:hypothetical protein NLX83_33505 [Allokutzneria sp. A3M-2-11 16]|uniref:hypothetical protein n=1 Tax=Allokutzneria sp. A3M-2-11 16 TaxID=2962043 RepID=UPI0020B7C120|nr:hypothetical protein [Allokutzneria sp. A3M-2-11 16]MCP3804201.1 hypothetical protein [Allokutzneria sp. A3M-2-11 16]